LSAREEKTDDASANDSTLFDDAVFHIPVCSRGSRAFVEHTPFRLSRKNSPVSFVLASSTSLVTR